MADDRNQRRQEVSRVKGENEQDLLGLANVTGVFTGTKVTGGVDTGTIAIVVTVSEKKDVPAKQRVPAEINGIPTDVIEEVIEPMQMANAIRLEDLEPVVDATMYATLEGGMSIGPCRSFFLEPPEVAEAGNYVFVGTLGCMVTDNATNDPMMLSNFHVMCVDDSWSVGDTMAQPSRVDGGSCPADQVGALARAQLTPSVDGAVASISGRPHVCEILEIGDINGTAVAAQNMAVRKRGRTTELTHGTVTAVDYTTSVDYGDGLGVVTFTNQIRIVNDAAQSAFFGKKGDSGSVVVDSSNNVVGLYFAGNSTGTVGVANQIAAVLSALDVSMCSGGIKKFEKEWAKEFLNDKWLKHEKLEIKEIEVKERLKDYIKEWKEYAYEKFGQFENFEPWERDPWERWGGGGPPVVGAPPVVGGRPPVFRGPSAAGTTAMGGWSRPKPNCVDFTTLAVGPGPNPVPASPFHVRVLDHLGAPLGATQVVNWGSFTGLNAGFTAEIKVERECPTVQATLVHFAQPATMEAYNSDGSLAGTSTMTPTQMLEQTLTIEGTAISFVRITCPSNETILLSLCCCADTTCKSAEEDKPYLADHKAVVKDKELKEPKDFKEPHKEKLEFKEQIKEPKELKEQVKEPKEFKEQIKDGKEPKEIREGGFEHFIPPSMRPDLGRGALSREADRGGGPRMRRNPC